MLIQIIFMMYDWYIALYFTLSVQFWVTFQEKGSTPLHVAVKSDQKLQVELLLVYGADPTCPDNQGRTPLDYARYLFINIIIKMYLFQVDINLWTI